MDLAGKIWKLIGFVSAVLLKTKVGFGSNGVTSVFLFKFFLSGKLPIREGYKLNLVFGKGRGQN